LRIRATQPEVDCQRQGDGILAARPILQRLSSGGLIMKKLALLSICVTLAVGGAQGRAWGNSVSFDVPRAAGSGAGDDDIPLISVLRGRPEVIAIAVRVERHAPPTNAADKTSGPFVRPTFPALMI
jgi:hypothetical protein